MNFLKLNYIHYLLIAFTLSVFFFVYIAINNSDEVIGDTMIIDNLTTESNQRWVFFTDRVMGGVSSGSLKLVEEKVINSIR